MVLNMRSLEPLDHPVRFSELKKRAPSRLRTHLDRIFSSGGKLPPKSLGALIDILLSIQPDLVARLGRFSQRRNEIIARLAQTSRFNLAIQKETLTTALQIAGLGTEDLLNWSPETADCHTRTSGKMRQLFPISRPFPDLKPSRISSLQQRFFRTLRILPFA